MLLLEARTFCTGIMVSMAVGEQELAIHLGDPWQKDTGHKTLAGGSGCRAFVELGKSTAGSCRMVNQALRVYFITSAHLQALDLMAL